MEKFLKSKNYIELKKKYEKEYFKLGGEYAWYDGDKVVNKSTSKIAEHFKNKKVTIEIEREDDDGEIITTKKQKTFYQVWSEDPKMKEYDEVIFNCDTDKVKPNQFNLFDGFSIKDHKIVDKKVAKVGLAAVMKHISLLCNHNEDGIRVTKYFYAQALQQPHILPNFCLVFISKEGVGKDIFSDFIENVFGEKYCFNTDKLENLVGRFNSMFGAKIMGVVNETDPIDSHQRRDNIKYAITAKKVQIEGKHKDPVKAFNYCRLTFFANRLAAFPIENGSRRPYIQYSSAEMLPKYCGATKSKAYFDNLGKYMFNRDVQKAFYDELMKFDVENFNFKEVDKSDLQKILEDAAKPVISEFLYNLVYNVDVEKNNVIKFKTVELLTKYTEYTKKRNMKFDMNQRTFNTEIEQEYKIKKFMSCGTPKFLINVTELKQLLTEEYKYKFDEDDDDDDDEDSEDSDEEKELNKGVIKKNMSVTLSVDEQIAHYTKLLNDTSKILNNLQYEKLGLIQPTNKSDNKPKKNPFGVIKNVSNKKAQDTQDSKRLDISKTKTKDIDVSDIATIDFSKL